VLDDGQQARVVAMYGKTYCQRAHLRCPLVIICDYQRAIAISMAGFGMFGKHPSMSKVSICTSPSALRSRYVESRNAGTSRVRGNWNCPGRGWLAAKYHARPAFPRMARIGCRVPGAIGRTFFHLSARIAGSITLFALKRTHGVFCPPCGSKRPYWYKPRSFYSVLYRPTLVGARGCTRLHDIFMCTLLAVFLKLPASKFSGDDLAIAGVFVIHAI
jgi:hypothetical protein